MPAMRRLPLLLLLCCCGPPAAASTVFKCTAAHGGVSYQDHPCAPGQRQETVRLDDAAPAPPPVATAPAPAPPPAAAAPPEPPPPPAPLPTLYSCVRATDGKSYLSGNGNPAPYQAPLGVLGAFQQSLSQVYGPDRGAAGMSAPEANRGRVSSALVANNYVWVQDRCRELGPAETCEALRDAYDENERKLQRAFDSQKPPLEARERELAAQLRGC
jgi:hypothetical protein